MQLLRYSVLIALVTASLFACKKEKDTDDPEPSDRALVGEWELHHSFGGMMSPATYPAGNGNLLRFDSTTYQMIRGGQIIHQGSYTLLNDSIVDVNSCALLPPKSSAPNTIIYSNNTSIKSFFEITGNTLKLTSGCMPLDGGGSIYKRKSGGN